MKELKNIKKILYIAIAIIIVAGAIVSKTTGFKKELLYSNRQEIVLSNGTELDVEKIEEISKSVLENKKVKVQKIERFGNAVEIISTEITEEEKENIINKVNEQYGADISNETINIVTVPAIRVRDAIKPYIVPGIVSLILVVVYFAIVYNKLGIKKVMLKGIIMPIISELTFYSLVAIIRIPFGRITNILAIGIYILTIGTISMCFQNERNKLKNESDGNN